MALTPEQLTKRLKIAYIILAAAFIAMPITGVFNIFFDIHFPIPLLIMPLFAICLFYIMYLKASNAATIIKMAKPLAEAMVDVQNEVIGRVDGNKIGQKIGEVIEGIQTPNNSNTSNTENSQVVKIRCTACSHLNDETDKFCSNCGAQL